MTELPLPSNPIHATQQNPYIPFPSIRRGRFSPVARAARAPEPAQNRAPTTRSAPLQYLLGAAWSRRQIQPRPASQPPETPLPDATAPPSSRARKSPVGDSPGVPLNNR
jgi:hypothetical protein